MLIPIDEIAGIIRQHRIQAYAFLQYRVFYILAVHPVSPELATFVPAPFQMSGVMNQGISLSDSEKILSHRFCNEGSITLHCICFGEMPLQEHFKLVNPDEVRRIGNYRGQERPITFIPPQLSLSIASTCDEYRIKSDSIFHNPHERIDLELPLRV